MERRYFTKNGSIYINKIEGGGDFWLKQDKGGRTQALAGGIHISRKKLNELIKEYPSLWMDRTYNFEVNVEMEFFEDARRERYRGSIEKEDTVIFFLIKIEPHKYAMGFSSLVERIEEGE